MTKIISLLTLCTALKIFAAQTDTISVKAFAVIELFTSEGCSSCPAADHYLSTLMDDAKKQNQPLYLLSFHVDYWNRLGWTDPFSRPEYSERQKRYADILGARVYTPQMIVNGMNEGVGSDTKQIKTFIQSALKNTADHSYPMQLSVAVAPQPGLSVCNIGVTYQILAPSADLKKTEIHFALVEKGLSVSVARGENQGRRLRHDNVVRAFQTRALDSTGAGTFVFSIPEAVILQASSLIAYVQDSKSLAILAVQKRSLPEMR